MSVYTGRGDEGQTDLFSGERVSKTSSRIEGYGSVDELNSLVGVAVSHIDDNAPDIQSYLVDVQDQLHVICANLANTEESPDRPEITKEDIEELEIRIDELDEELPPLKQFILPGGSEAGSFLHYARSVCRRTERVVLAADADHDISDTVIKYLNRLSDFLFVAARSINHESGETEYNPSYD